MCLYLCDVPGFILKKSKCGDGGKARCQEAEGEKKHTATVDIHLVVGGIIDLFRFFCYFWTQQSVGAWGVQGCGGELQTGSKRCTEKSHFNCINMK